MPSTEIYTLSLHDALPIFGSGAILKLIPDTCAMLAFYAFFWRSFDLTSVAALLTGIGYSVNDVIVVYDRIRENIQTNPRRSFQDRKSTRLNSSHRCISYAVHRDLHSFPT